MVPGSLGFLGFLDFSRCIRYFLVWVVWVVLEVWVGPSLGGPSLGGSKFGSCCLVLVKKDPSRAGREEGPTQTLAPTQKTQTTQTKK